MINQSCILDFEDSASVNCKRLQHSRMGDRLVITNEQPMEGKQSLRIVTYLLPSLPIEYFSLLVQYLESKLDLHICLMVETRAGGPLLDRPDPFTANEADIGSIILIFVPQIQDCMYGKQCKCKIIGETWFSG